jgi:hypothetical protein
MYQCRCTAKNSWWWAERLPETCRVVIPIKLEFSTCVGFIHKEIVTMHGHTILKNIWTKANLPGKLTFCNKVVQIWGHVTNFCMSVTGNLKCWQGNVRCLELWNCANVQNTTVRFLQMKEILFEYTEHPCSPLCYIKVLNINRMFTKISFSSLRNCVTIHYSGSDYAHSRLLMNCTNAALWDVACRNFA